MKNTYEISYWLKIDSDKEKVKKILEEMNLELIEEVPPKERVPAYPINKETIGLFGTLYFYAEPEKVEILKEKIRPLNDVLRFIILKRKYLKINNLNKSTTNESK